MSVAITAAAAILVALIAAVTAQQRQKAQLVAERERLDLTLESERERQRGEFVHDRELHDLGELRAVLDDAAGRLDLLRSGLENARWSLVQAEFHPGAQERPPHPDYDRDHPAPWAGIYSALRTVYEHAESLAALVPRLRIRFEKDEPVVALYEEAVAVAKRHPFAVDFVEEDATFLTMGGRLAEISDGLERLRSNWDGRAIVLARFTVGPGTEASR